jgi:hypothetical protein
MTFICTHHQLCVPVVIDIIPSNYQSINHRTVSTHHEPGSMSYVCNQIPPRYNRCNNTAARWKNIAYFVNYRTCQAFHGVAVWINSLSVQVLSPPLSPFVWTHLLNKCLLLPDTRAGDRWPRTGQTGYRTSVYVGGKFCFMIMSVGGNTG